MAFLNEAEFKERWLTALTKDIPPAQILDCLHLAKTIIENKIEAAIFTAVDGDADNSEDSTKTIRLAHSKLAYRELLSFQSGRFRNGGIAKLELDDAGQGKNEYQAYSETQKMKADLWNEAMGYLEPFYKTETVEEIAVSLNRSRVVPVSFGW